jgi:hypothetical protein
MSGARMRVNIIVVFPVETAYVSSQGPFPMFGLHLVPLPEARFFDVIRARFRAKLPPDFLPCLDRTIFAVCSCPDTSQRDLMPPNFQRSSRMVSWPMLRLRLVEKQALMERHGASGVMPSKFSCSIPDEKVSCFEVPLRGKKAYSRRIRTLEISVMRTRRD